MAAATVAVSTARMMPSTSAVRSARNARQRSGRARVASVPMPGGEIAETIRQRQAHQVGRARQPFDRLGPAELLDGPLRILESDLIPACKRQT